MASLVAIRDAVKATVETNVTELQVYDTVPDSVTPPAVIVMPIEANFDVAFARGFDTYQIDLLVLSSNSVARSSQDALDAYVTGSGPRSVRAAIFANRTLGLSDNTDAHVSGMSAYGKFSISGIDYTGARLRLVVTTPGTA